MRRSVQSISYSLYKLGDGNKQRSRRSTEKQYCEANEESKLNRNAHESSTDSLSSNASSPRPGVRIDQLKLRTNTRSTSSTNFLQDLVIQFSGRQDKKRSKFVLIKEEIFQLQSQLMGDSLRNGTRLKLGSIVEPQHNVEDKFGNEILALGITQEIGFKDQDRYDVRLGEYYYVSVLDGHGTSDFAVDFCMQHLFDRIKRHAKNELPEDEAIKRAFEEVHDEICNTKDIDPRTGACLVSLFIPKPEAGNFIDSVRKDAEEVPCKVAWVGDCRAILISSENEVVELTCDHRVDSNESEKRRISETKFEPIVELIQNEAWKTIAADAARQGLAVYPHPFIGKRVNIDGTKSNSNCVFAHTGGVSLEVTRSIGDKTAAPCIISTPEIKSFNLKRGRRYRMILGSDGLFDVLQCKKIAQLANKVESPRKLSRLLAKKAKERRLYWGKQIDDITALVLDITQ